MIFCILDLLILIWDIVIIVHAFVTKNVIWTTWSLMAVALWLLVTIILDLKNDIENRVKRRRMKISKLCDRKCEDCKFDHKCSDKVEVTEYRYGGKKDRMSEHMLWETIDEQKQKIADLEQDLEHKKIAIRSRNARIKELEAQIEKMQEKLKADLIARLEEQMQYSTSPSCTKGMELFIRSIEEWEIKEND